MKLIFVFVFLLTINCHALNLGLALIQEKSQNQFTLELLQKQTGPLLLDLQQMLDELAMLEDPLLWDMNDFSPANDENRLEAGVLFDSSGSLFKK